MRRSVIAVLSAVMAVGLTTTSTATQQARVTTNPAAPYRAMLDQYCVTCHNERAKTAGLMLDKMDLDRVAVSAETWKK